jgi:hypothetical protein
MALSRSRGVTAQKLSFSSVGIMEMENLIMSFFSSTLLRWIVSRQAPQRAACR